MLKQEACWPTQRLASFFSYTGREIRVRQHTSSSTSHARKSTGTDTESIGRWIARSRVVSPVRALSLSWKKTRGAVRVHPFGTRWTPWLPNLG
jgi:hypothetical protein